MTGAFAHLAVHDWRQFRSVEIDFHDRLTVITGANGAGKTTLLNLLGRHFGWTIPFIATSRLTRAGAYRYFSGVGEYLFEDDNPRRPVGHFVYGSGLEARMTVPVEVAESFDVAIENRQPVEGIFLPSHRPVYSYQRVDNIPTAVSASAQIFDAYYANLRAAYEPNTRRTSASHQLKSALISLATFGYGNQVVEANPEARSTFEGFERVLRMVLPPRLGFTKLSIRLPEVVLECTSGDFSLDAASGGVSAIIDLAWQLYMKSLIATSFVAICDEPENHLHPELQRTLLIGLIDAFPQVQFIVATHNPFMVTSVQDSAVVVLDYVDDRVESKRLDEIDRSGSANQVLMDVLGVPVPLPIWVEQRVEAVAQRFAGETLTEAMLGDLRREMNQVGLGHLFPTAVERVLKRPQP